MEITEWPGLDGTSETIHEQGCHPLDQLAQGPGVSSDRNVDSSWDLSVQILFWGVKTLVRVKYDTGLTH